MTLVLNSMWFEIHDRPKTWGDHGRIGRTADNDLEHYYGFIECIVKCYVVFNTHINNWKDKLNLLTLPRKSKLYVHFISEK